MAKNIDPKLKKIGEYLKLEENTTFVIPEYQRAYLWGINNCDKLWQDIEDFIENGGEDPYFFGTIIINCQKNDTELSLIDGQQRTTTFILLLKALLLRLVSAIEETKLDNDSEKLTYSLQGRRDSLIKIIYKVKNDQVYDVLNNFESAEIDNLLYNFSNNELYKSELNKILRGKDFEEIEKEVEKIPYKQKDNKYTNYFRNFKFFYNKLKDLSTFRINIFAGYILEKSEIIEIRSWNVEQAITMFNSLNSDGLPLLDADIISAKLYSNSGIDREDFNNKWKELKEILRNLDAKKITDIDGILMQYMYIKRAIDRSYVLGKGSVNVTTPGLRRYYIEINTKLLTNPLSLTAKFLKIARIWEKIQDYSIINLSFKFNENFKLYLMSYLFRFELDEITEVLVVSFLEQLLKLFTILELVDTGYSSSKFKTFLFSLNVKLVDKTITIEEIKQEIKNHISREWSPEEIKEAIKDYNKNSIVYLKEYIYAKQSGNKFILPEKYEIEHTMPMSGKNLEEIRKDAKIYSKEEFESVVNKVGNKVLLEENINRSLGNAWFRTKIQSSVKERKGYKDSQFYSVQNLLEQFKGVINPEWTIDEIMAKTEENADMITNFIFE